MVTRKDIAKRAGVSVSVVSRALNNSGYVEAEKRERILRIAEELDYHPNPVAMSLMRQRTKQLLFYCRNMDNSFNTELYLGMKEQAEKQGYMVAVNGSLDFRYVRGIMADGIILADEAIAESYMCMVGKNYYLPAVAATYGRRMSYPRSLPVVESDLWSGMVKMLDYLRGKGHRKIALISPNDADDASARDLAWRSYMAQEFEGNLDDYCFEINRKSMHMDPRIMEIPEERMDGILLPEKFFEKGTLAAEVFRERGCDATAAVCFNDEMAMGFCKRLRQLGYRIPDDLSVMGIDGIEARKYADQTLTTLAINPYLQGQKCAAVLLDVINGKKFKYATYIPTQIVEGETVRSIRRY